MKLKFALCVLLVLSLFSCSKNKYIVLLGYPLDVDKEGIFDSFAYSKMTISSLYQMLSKDCELVNTKKRISYYIEKADKIILNIGLYDILSFVKIIDGKVMYSTDKFDEKDELFSYYFYETIDLIYEMNKKAKLLVLGIYNPLNIEEKDKLTHIIKLFNESEKEIISSYPFEYVSLDYISSYIDKNFSLNDEGKLLYLQSIDNFLNESK